MVADLLERRDRGEHGSVAPRCQRIGGLREEVVEHRLIEPDLLGGHRAMVEFVDLVREFGGDLRLALRAPEQQQPVERTQSRLGVAGELRDELCSQGPTRPGLVKSRMAHRSAADPVLDRGAGQRQPCAGGDSAQCLRRLARRVLDRLRLVEHHRRPLGLGQCIDVAHRGGVGRDHDVCVGDLLLQLGVRGTRCAVVHEHTQVRSEAGGLGSPVADHHGRSDDQRRDPDLHCGRGGRARSVSFPGPCRARDIRRVRWWRGS